MVFSSPDRLSRVVDALDKGASIRAVADAEGITPKAVRYWLRKALRSGILVTIDGRGRHKHPAYRRPRASGPLDAALRRVTPPAEQPVAVPPSIPRDGTMAGKPDKAWRHIEHAEFRWKVVLGRPELVPWDPGTERMKNGTRVFKRRHAYLGHVWGTVQLYSGTFRAVLHLDKVPVRWADMARWNDILFSLAMDAQARLARDLADLGTSVDQTLPDPIEDDKAKAARARGEPSLVTGELHIPVAGADHVPRVFVSPTTEFNRTPPGPGAETGSILWGYVADHLPDRVVALERWNERLGEKLDALDGRIARLEDALTKVAAAQERLATSMDKLASFFERLAGQEAGAQEKAAENPDNWRMFG